MLAGCDNSQNPAYPTEMKYPQREDLLVVKQPENTILFPFADPPGRLEETIAKADGLKNAELWNPKDPSKVPAKDRDELRKYLEATFGTPAQPTVHSDEEDQPMVEALKLEDVALAAGSKLYRRHCLQCHGVAGDGRGPSGPWLHPHPRDYRQGLFKFMSSAGDNARKPRRDDLHRTLTAGIEGTSMPSFAWLPEGDLQAIISYVIHLSIRGEVEFRMLVMVAKHQLDADVKSEAQKWTTLALQRWKNSDSSQLVPKNAAPPANESQRLESVRRGYEIFTDAKKGQCLSCHVDFGRQAQFRYDAWGTLTRPRNLTEPVYRGGRRPIDFYWRLSGGIVPCEMPALKIDDEAQVRDVWDLVNFVQALPYRGMLPDGKDGGLDVQGRVYPKYHGSEHTVAER
jgi:mono/diheme cytochrome c family protein